MGLYVGSIVFIINILVITLELFYQYLTQLNKGEESLFILKEKNLTYWYTDNGHS